MHRLGILQGGFNAELCLPGQDPGQTLGACFTRTRTLVYLPTKLFSPRRVSKVFLFPPPLSNPLQAPTFLLLTASGEMFPFQISITIIQHLLLLPVLKAPGRSPTQNPQPTNVPAPWAPPPSFPLVLAHTLPSQKTLGLDLQESFPMLDLFI